MKQKNKYDFSQDPVIKKLDEMIKIMKQMNKESRKFHSNCWPKHEKNK